MFAQAVASQNYLPVLDRTAGIAEEFFQSALGNVENLDVVSEHFESEFNDRQTQMINAMEDQLHTAYLQTG